jgi:hypothetical protein
MVMAKLAFTMVPGSVEEERMLSAMKFLQNAQRNRLLDEYLSAAARLFKTRSRPSCSRAHSSSGTR